MKIKDFSLTELRGRYANKENGFVIKIREESKKPDIVYYNGIKAFFVKKNKNDKYMIEITDNIYKLNKSNIVQSRDNIDELIEAIKNVRYDVENYFELSFDKIKLDIGTAYYRDTYDQKKVLKTNYKEVQKNAEMILYKIKKELEKFSIFFDVSKIINDIDRKYEEKLNNFLNKYPTLNDDSIKELNVYEKIAILMNKLNKDDKEKLLDSLSPVKVSVFTIDKEFTLEESLEIEKIFIFNTIFIDNFKYCQHTGFKIPKINYKFKNKEIDGNQLNEFDSTIKNAIEHYEKTSGEELEKKYQHMFMLNDSVLEKFSQEGIQKIEPFEEEYYTKEAENENNNDDKKRGRIDCVFIRPDSNVSDIYLIELKVNDSVIGSLDKNKNEHGIVEHLEDIHELCNKKDYLKKFLDRLNTRYNDRREIVNNIKEKVNLKENYNLHFWIIIAITDTGGTLKENAKKVLNKIKALEKSSKLEMKYNKKCEIRLLFDKWYRTNNNNEISSEKFLTLKEFKEKFDNEN